MNTLVENENKIFWLCVTNFFFALQYASIVYSTSLFFADIVHTKNIWIVYTVAAIFSLVLNSLVSRALRGVEINRFISKTILLSIVSTTLLFYTSYPLLVVIEYVLLYGLSALLYNLFSISLEEFSKNTSTGATRGIFNASGSAAYLLGPFLTSFFIPYYGIHSIFMFSTCIGIVGYLVFRNYAKITRNYTVHPQSAKGNFRKLFKNRDLLYITIAQLGVNAFFISMVVFLPFKLQSIGISLTQYLSVLLPVALSPFLFVPPILGAYEDKMKDEKQILTTAYFGIIFCLIVISFMNTTSLFAWGAIMFLARFCASAAEISTNSYFYKKVKAEEVSIISTFVSTEYFAYLFFSPILTFLYVFSGVDIVFLTVSFFFSFVLVLVSKLHNLANYEKHKTWKEIWRRSKKRTA